jgi:hypothetical protein
VRSAPFPAFSGEHLKERAMSDAATLFPGRLAACYEAFVAAVEAEGGAREEFKKTQVSFGLVRKFTWLTPLSKSKCLLLLDMYEKQPDPLFRDIIEYRVDKFTHQIELDNPDLIKQASEAGWFRLAYEWGAKTRS